MLGWPLQLLALSLAPLVVVQPALALGLPVLMVMGERMLGERAGRREYLAVGAIVLGVSARGCARRRAQSRTRIGLCWRLCWARWRWRACCPTCCCVSAGRCRS